jgi:hypothetical protein
MSNQEDAKCMRTLTMVISALFGFFIAMIFLARAIVY